MTPSPRDMLIVIMADLTARIRDIKDCLSEEGWISVKIGLIDLLQNDLSTCGLDKDVIKQKIQDEIDKLHKK